MKYMIRCVTLLFCLGIFSNAFVFGQTPPEKKDPKKTEIYPKIPPKNIETKTLKPIKVPKIHEEEDENSQEIQYEKIFPYFEHHGYFRFRAQMWHKADLNNQSPGVSYPSAFRVPLTEEDKISQRWGRSAHTISGANIRFRYEPSIFLTENLRIKAQIDMLDNLVLGSTPEGYYPANYNIKGTPIAPLQILTETQVPSDSRNSIVNSVLVKRAWGEWQTPIGLLMVGRMPSDWGLGILDNDGSCDNCDYGTTRDRIAFVAKPFGGKYNYYLGLGFDFVSEGLVNFGDTSNYLGQPRDIEQLDDVNQIFLTFFKRNLSPKEKLEQRVLQSQNKPFFEFGALIRYRNQALNTEEGRYQYGDATYGTCTDASCILERRDAWMVTSDIWFRFNYRIKHRYELNMELEALYNVGQVRYAMKSNPNSWVDIDQWGLVFKADMQIKKLFFGLEYGWASGDSSATGFEANTGMPDFTKRRHLRAFKFNRDYQVDYLLFKEVIGTVTNAHYLRPWIKYDIRAYDLERFGARLDIVFSMASTPESTPGKDRLLGLEFDISIYLLEIGVFRADLTYGVLIPFAGLENLTGLAGQDPEVCHTLQARLIFKF